MRTEIAPEQRCMCANPKPSGSFYLGRERCRACNCFVVRSPLERIELRALDLAALVQERELAVPVNRDGPLARMSERKFAERFPTLAAAAR